MHACACVHICIHTYIRKYIHTYIHTYVRIYIYIHTHKHTNAHTYVYTYIYIRTYIHIHIHTYIHTYIFIYMHIYIHTYIYIYTRIHTYIKIDMHESRQKDNYHPIQHTTRTLSVEFPFYTIYSILLFGPSLSPPLLSLFSSSKLIHSFSFCQLPIFRFLLFCVI